MDKSKSLYAKVLKNVYGLSPRSLMELPFEFRQGVREVAFSMCSALETGCASRPENNDPLTDQ